MTSDNALEIPAATKAALERYADVERRRQKNPAIAELITWRSLAQHILRNEVEKRGYYSIPRKPTREDLRNASDVAKRNDSVPMPLYARE